MFEFFLKIGVVCFCVGLYLLLSAYYTKKYSGSISKYFFKFGLFKLILLNGRKKYNNSLYDICENFIYIFKLFFALFSYFLFYIGIIFLTLSSMIYFF